MSLGGTWFVVYDNALVDIVSYRLYQEVGHSSVSSGSFMRSMRAQCFVLFRVSPVRTTSIPLFCSRIVRAPPSCVDWRWSWRLSRLVFRLFSRRITRGMLLLLGDASHGGTLLKRRHWRVESLCLGRIFVCCGSGRCLLPWLTHRVIQFFLWLNRIGYCKRRMVSPERIRRKQDYCFFLFSFFAFFAFFAN